MRARTRRVRAKCRELYVVGRVVWVNLALLVAMLLGATLLMWSARSYPQASFLDLLVDSLHLARLERVVSPGDGPIPIALTFALPVLTAIILGEGVVRVFSAYLNRAHHRQEWELLVAQTFTGHTVICGAGELGRALFRRLIQADPEARIVVVDPRPDILSEFAYSGPNACHIQADMTVLSTLEAAHCRRAKVILLASGNDAFNLEAGFKAKQLNPEIEVWIRLYRSDLATLMDVSANDNVHFFCPYERAAEQLADALIEAERNPRQRAGTGGPSATGARAV